MTQSSFAGSQAAWQHDRQSNAPWRSIYRDATAFRDYQTNTEPRKHYFTLTINLLLQDWLCSASLWAQRFKKIEIYESQKAIATQSQAILHSCFPPTKGWPLRAYRNQVHSGKKLPINVKFWEVREPSSRQASIMCSYFIKQKSRNLFTWVLSSVVIEDLYANNISKMLVLLRTPFCE